MSERLKPLIKEALREALDEGLMRTGCCSSCDLAPREHATHHQLLRDAFSLRSRVINIVITSVVGGGLFWLGMAVWEKLVRQALK